MPLHKEAASQIPRMGEMGAVEEGDGGKLRSHSNKLYPGSLAGVRHPMPRRPGYLLAGLCDDRRILPTATLGLNCACSFVPPFFFIIIRVAP